MEDRVRLDVNQGECVRFQVRCAGWDMTLYDVYLQVRERYASRPVDAAKPPIFALSLVANASPDNAIAYGAPVEGVVDSVDVTFHADKTVLLENPEAITTAPQYLADVLFVLKSDPSKFRERLTDLDLYICPRVTVVE